MTEPYYWHECRLCGERVPRWRFYDHLTDNHNFKGTYEERDYFFMPCISARSPDVVLKVKSHDARA